MRKRISILLAILISTFLFYSPSFAQSSPIFGPKTYIREKGKPEEFKEVIQVCALQGVYKLIVENGLYTEIEEEDEDKEEEKEEKKTKISAGEIKINGEEITEEDDFNKKVTRIERSILLPQGENQMEIEVEGKPGAYITVIIECTSGCLEPRITLPTTNSIINKSKAIIQGNLSNIYGEAGVTIQSSGASGQVSGLAQIQGNNFAGTIPLQVGINTITATATDACGYKVTDTITIQTDTLQESIRLTAIPSSGIPILNVTFEAEAYLTNPVSNYSWDLDGDGTPDQTGSTLSTLTTQYQYPRLYFPKVTITDTQGNTYEETAIVNVLSREEMEALLKGKWEGMREGLSQGDIETALTYFVAGSRDKYKTIFTELGSNKINSIFSGISEFRLYTFYGQRAECGAIRIESVGTYSYPVIFVQDENGIWKIMGF